MSTPRLVIAGLNGGTGKTILTLGVIRALTRGGLAIKPFKKGPDYIDAAWLGIAAGHHATNLDPYFLSADQLRSLYAWASEGADLAVIEGNRGLYDGRDVTGSCSTAELARTLAAPVVLAMDCTKMTRTAAAIVLGMRTLEPDVHIAGVVLNRTASERHRTILRQCIEQYTDVPVLGALPKMTRNPIPERHMGLVSDREYEACAAGLDAVGDWVAEHVDMDRMVALARAAQPLPEGAPFWNEPVQLASPPRIGYVRDAALWFYYEENFEALRRAGAELVELRLLDGDPWPRLDGLYLGGGFPETLAARISASPGLLQAVRSMADDGLPIYAECGGFMVLGESIVMDGQAYPMAGVFPVRTEFHAKPQGLGYVEATVVAENPYHPLGAVLRGHEFHYSRCVAEADADVRFGLQLQPGTGMGNGRDGLLYRNTFASYTHLFGPGVPHWAEQFVAVASAYKAARLQ